MMRNNKICYKVFKYLDTHHNKYTKLHLLNQTEKLRKLRFDFSRNSIVDTTLSRQNLSSLVGKIVTFLE